MLLVKAYVQDTSLVISNTSGWFPVGFDIPYDTGTVGRASDHGIVIVLEA